MARSRRKGLWARVSWTSPKEGAERGGNGRQDVGWEGFLVLGKYGDLEDWTGRLEGDGVRYSV